MSDSNSSGDRWEQVLRVFDAATQRPVAERAALLDRMCGSDADLREEVESMLQAEVKADAFFGDLEASVFGRRGDDDPYQGKADAQVGPYRLLSRIGSGGMGVVYKARDTRLDRVVALKMLPPRLQHDDEARARFLREARAAAALQHPNACAVHDVGERRDGGLFIAMDHCEGQTLATRLRDGALDPDVARQIALQAARALEAAHDAGLVHRDVKPSNLILNEPDRDSLVVKVIDFGLAKHPNGDLTADGVVQGTVAYMSPEQTRGASVGPPADVWAIGVLLFEMLTGGRPFRGDAHAPLIHAIRNDAPGLDDVRSSGASDRLVDVVDRCLEKDPADRFADGKALREALDGPETETPPSWDGVGERIGRRGMFSAMVVSVLGMAGLVALLFFAPTFTAAPDVQRVVVTAAERSGGADSTAAGPSVRRASIEAGRRSDVLAAGLVHATTDRLRRATAGDTTLAIIPPPDGARAPRSLSAAEARQRYGATHLIRLHGETTSTTVSVTVDLVGTEHGRVLERREIHGAVGAVETLPDTTAAATASLLGIDLQTVGPATQRTPGRVRDYYTQGIGYLESNHIPGNVDAALGLFRRAINEDSTSALAFSGLGRGFWRKYTATRDPAWIDSATAVSERALLLDGALPEAHVTLGRVDTERGRNGSALAHFRHALREKPSSLPARRGVAKALEAAGREEAAEAAYRDIVEREPAYSGGFVDLGIFLIRQGRYDEAADAFREAVALAPNNAVAHRNRGAAHFLMGDLDAATNAFEHALRVAPDYATHTNLGTVLVARGRYADAADAFADALALQDADHRVWSSLAEALYWSGRRDSARAAFREALDRAETQLEANPTRMRTLAYVADYHAVLGDTAQARRFLDRAVAQTTESVDVTFRVGATFALLGAFDRAHRWMQKAVDRGYRFQPRERYPRLTFLWDRPDFRRLIERSRRDESSSHAR